MLATRSRFRAALCAAPLVALGLTLVAAPASMAQSRITSLVPRTTSQEIVSYDVVAEVQPNTDMVITETIVYDLGPRRSVAGLFEISRFATPSIVGICGFTTCNFFP